jgi:hypothetical protein
VTDQPRNITATFDPITTFMGLLPPDEHEQRRRIHVARNCGAWKARETDNGIARALAWIVTDIATDRVFAPAPVDELAEVAELLLQLLNCADRAEIVEACA